MSCFGRNYQKHLNEKYNLVKDNYELLLFEIKHKCIKFINSNIDKIDYYRHLESNKDIFNELSVQNENYDNIKMFIDKELKELNDKMEMM